MAVRGVLERCVTLCSRNTFKPVHVLKRNSSVLSSPRNDEIAANEDSNILRHPDFFGLRGCFDVKSLFEKRVHLGHKTVMRNPYMRPFIFGNRLGVDIIDLNKTSNLLGDALNFTAHIAARKGIILMLTRIPQNVPYVEKVALTCGEYSHCRKWRRGTFTNSSVQYGAMTRLPDLCIFFSTLNDVFEEHVAVIESAKLNIPTIGIVDTNCDPRLITYPIPGNDDSTSSVHYLADLFKEAIIRGKNYASHKNE